MSVWDIAIVESGGYGDFTLNGNDLAVFKGLENAIYLAMFGGNLEADTKPQRQKGVQAFDYWGNTLLFSQLPKAQFNSLTERTLNNTELTSQGRVTIENAIKNDLSFLPNLNVSVSIVSTDRINVSVRTILPNGTEAVGSFAFVYNPLTGDFDLTDFDFADFF